MFSFLFVISFGNDRRVEVLSSNALYNGNCYAFQCITMGGAPKNKDVQNTNLSHSVMLPVGTMAVALMPSQIQPRGHVLIGDEVEDNLWFSGN